MSVRTLCRHELKGFSEDPSPFTCWESFGLFTVPFRGVHGAVLLDQHLTTAVYLDTMISSGLELQEISIHSKASKLYKKCVQETSARGNCKVAAESFSFEGGEMKIIIYSVPLDYRASYYVAVRGRESWCGVLMRKMITAYLSIRKIGCMDITILVMSFLGYLGLRDMECMSKEEMRVKFLDCSSSCLRCKMSDLWWNTLEYNGI